MTRLTLSDLLPRLGSAPADPGWPDDGWPIRGKIQPASFEVAVGAVLTQNTRWSQAAAAAENLVSAGLTGPGSVLSAPAGELETAVRPAGFPSTKAGTLRQLGRVWLELGGDCPARELLLRVKGVGPETADTILLYGFGSPRLIADGYLRRLCGRLGLLPERVPYEKARCILEPSAEGLDAVSLQVLHARIVRFGKVYCRKTPACTDCPLRRDCPTGRPIAPG